MLEGVGNMQVDAGEGTKTLIHCWWEWQPIWKSV
jgi:hypothetical protein